MRPSAHGRCWVSEDTAEWLEGDSGSDLYIRTDTHMALTPNPLHSEGLDIVSPKPQSPPPSSRAGTARKLPAATRDARSHSGQRGLEERRAADSHTGSSPSPWPCSPVGHRPASPSRRLQLPALHGSSPPQPHQFPRRPPRTRSTLHLAGLAPLFPAHSHVPKSPSHLLPEALNRPPFKAQHSRAWLCTQHRWRPLGLVMRPPVQLWSQGYRKPLCHQLPPGSCLEGPEHSLWGPVSPILQ